MLCVKVGKFHSDQIFRPFDAPQGSVLGRIVFAIYLQSVTEIMKDHNLQYHQYADDTQLYKVLNTTHLNLTIQTKQKWILYIINKRIMG